MMQPFRLLQIQYFSSVLRGMDYLDMDYPTIIFPPYSVFLICNDIELACDLLLICLVLGVGTKVTAISYSMYALSLRNCVSEFGSPECAWICKLASTIQLHYDSIYWKPLR